ncbi:2-dehydropantoate 2-reductase [Labilithrix luteola]|uniref:2-dehydropantoate 2-reductase n=1 Tax=Labilithrix luteola TaxID=1391654 RepID=A0A0K1Q1A0_9BACT|nr:2-dehydropantoate 2-reductase [Labilithrix luteola]AKU99401.1 2-dehydropantoate 2-reductase [Labilithrix luteola]
MKICIFGAGAIGGHLGAKLALAGVDVTFVARGENLRAIRDKGITLVEGGERKTAHPRCVATAGEAGPQDYVLLTTKAHSLVSAAPEVAALLGDDTAIVSAINGVPWWYFHGLDSPHGGRVVESVDPGGAVSRFLPPARAIGCIVHPAVEVTEPGVVVHQYGDRYALGEPDGTKSERATRLSKVLHDAGLKAPVSTHIRDELWIKLWGNMAFNPVSLLTGATLDRIVGEPGSRGVCRQMMVEGKAVGEALGARFGITVDRRLDGAAAVGVHKTSMLQDLERGRPIELDALLGAVVELAEVAGVDVPTCRIVLALARQKASVAGV